MRFLLFIVLIAILLTPNWVYAVCPLCIGVALGGSILSKFIPGLKGTVITSLWMGFLLYSTAKYSYEKIAIYILTASRKKKVLIKALFYITFFCTYFLFLISIFFISGRQLSQSWFFAYHSGFFVAMAGYEFYHWLFDKGIKIKYGNIFLPILFSVLASVIFYFA